VHRIGRTARAGAGGSAVAVCGEEERNLLRDIQKVTRQTIPSEDRRGDRGLGVMTAALPKEVHERAPADSREGRGEGGGRSGRGGGGGRNGRGASAGHRGGGGGGMDARPEGRSELPGGLRKQRARPAAQSGGGGRGGQASSGRPTGGAPTTPIDQSQFRGPKRGAGSPVPEKRWSPVD
jgi:ATP-dependent RNA helicase RhlE